MYAGKAVITSKRSSMPEVGGDAVQYCDPYDVESITEAIEKVVQNDSWRLRLEKLAFRRAGEFSYRKTARELLQVYQEFE